MSAQYLAEWLKKRDIPVVEMSGMGANRIRLRRVMDYVQQDTEPPHLFVYMGHGFKKSLVGFEIGALAFPKTHLVQKDVNDDQFKNTIFVSMACWSMNELGPSIVNKGALTYFGSIKPMMVGFGEDDRMYLNDFINVLTVIPRKLAQGSTTDEAFKSYQQLCKGYMDLYSQHPELKNIDKYYEAMEDNLKYYEYIGRGDVRWQK